MRKIKYILLSFFMLVLCGCAGSNVNAEGNTIYANNISFDRSNITCFVGESLNINNCGLKIEPQNATVQPKIMLNNSLVATYNEEYRSVSFIGVGNVKLVAEIEISATIFKRAELTISVENKPVFANSIHFANKTIELNLDETKSNNFVILPNNCTEKPIVSYETNDIVEFDVNTMLITPKKIGTEVVTIKVKCDNNSFVTDSFVVVVTNNVFATDLLIDVNNLTDLVLFTGDSGKLNINISPATYNKAIELIYDKTKLTINEDYSFEVNNVVGTGDIKVIVCISKTEKIEKLISYKIISPKDNIDIDLLLNNEIATNFYNGYSYVAKIKTTDIDFSYITFENCEFTYVGDNLFNIVFIDSGNKKVKAKYTYVGSINSKSIVYENNIFVYNAINDINFSLTNAETELLPINGTYNLHMINNAYENLALLDGIFNKANVTLNAKGVDVLQSDLQFEIIGESVELINNTIVSKSVGVSIIKIYSLDPNKFCKEFLINVEISVPTSIEAIDNIVLTLNGNLEDKSTLLNFEVLPKYAIFEKAEITINNDNVDFLDNEITATKYGSSIISISVGNLVKAIKVEVKLIPNKLCLDINGTLIENNTTYNLFVKDSLVINTKLYFENTLITDLVNVKFEGNIFENHLDKVNYLYLTFAKIGTGTLTFSFDNLEIKIIINCKVKNSIIKAEFVDDNLVLNSFLSTNYNLKYNLSLEHSELETTDLLTFGTCNESIAIVNNLGLVSIVGIGEVNINILVNGKICDTITLFINYEEIIYIDNATTLSSITNGSYLVTRDLNLTNFIAINSFSGKLDFNNHKITGLSNYLIKQIEENGVVKNLVIEGEYNPIDGINSLVAYNNYGTITNITLNNVLMKLTYNVTYNLSTICFNNFATISDVVIKNVEFKDYRENPQLSRSKIGGIAYENFGKIINITGNFIFSQIKSIGGIANVNHGDIENINLNITNNAIESSSFGGICFKITSINNKEIKFANINLEINLNGSNTISYGGIINNLAGIISFENVFVKNTFNIIVSPVDIGLFINAINVSNGEIVLINSGYNGVEGHNAVTNANLVGFIIK